jgi:hypothetical protein
MKRTAVLIAAGLALSGAAEALADNGGYVLQYAVKYARAEKPIRLPRVCKSACTLALKYESTCAPEGAELWFHAVSGAGEHNARMTRWVFNYYKPSVRSWIRANGGLTSRFIVLRGAALRRVVRVCE